MSASHARAAGRFSVSINWPFVLGASIVLVVLFLAARGPALAPRDPMESSSIQRVGDQWISPPFPPLTVPGFPLGSDSIGRDLLSQLLWAIRPTMAVVLLTAALRLLVGTAIGAAAGWSVRVGRALDLLIAGALALPVLIVALAVVAAIGIERGTWAFVLGLGLTGWAETASVVRDQTRILKGQAYVEAARALGGSDLHIVLGHVIRQIRALLWMLFAYEMSSTLVMVAALGFLGYFLGGETWVAISDSVAQRHSGAPELGQMLSGTIGSLYQGPWRAFAAGSMIFVIILGFNLLAEGLRLRLTSHAARPLPFAPAVERAGFWLEERVQAPLYSTFGRRRVHGALLLLLLLSAAVWWQGRTTGGAAVAAISVPGGHLWAGERHDAQGTLWAQASGPSAPAVAWQVAVADGLSGGPAVTAEGTLYLGGLDGFLYALDSEGGERWRTRLPAPPVGAPALDAEGRIYLTDQRGGLTLFLPDGKQAARWEGEGQPAATGPTVAADGSIFYGIGGEIQALRRVVVEERVALAPLWRAKLLNAPVSQPPRLSPDGSLLLWGNRIVMGATGVALTSGVPIGVDEYAIGADGYLYVRIQHTAGSMALTQWRFQGEGKAEMVQEISWPDARRFVSPPRQIGAMPNGVIWLAYYFDSIEDAKIGWTNAAGARIGVATFAHQPSRPIAVDQAGTLYTCGTPRTGGAECLAFPTGATAPRWQVALPGGTAVQGGALVPGTLYVTTREGTLYALRDED